MLMLRRLPLSRLQCFPARWTVARQFSAAAPAAGALNKSLESMASPTSSPNASISPLYESSGSSMALEALDSSDIVSEAVTATIPVTDAMMSEQAIAWYQYGSYYLQDFIAEVHTSLDVEWWAAIALSTLAIRLVMAPFAVPQLKGTSRLAVIRPEIQKLAEAFKAKTDPTPEDAKAHQLKSWALFKRYGASPFSGLKYAVVQMPVFYSFYIALRDIGLRFPDQLSSGGGMLWFPNLTAADPYMLLPIVSAGTFLLTMELGSEGVALDAKMKKIFRGMALLMVPVTSMFPSGVFVYWITNSLYAIGQVRFLRLPAVRKFFGIIDPNKPGALHELENQLRPPQQSRPASTGRRH